MDHRVAELDEQFAHSVYWITDRIAVGRYLTPERAGYLRRHGITHVLNVGENPSVVRPRDHGFRQIIDLPIVDLARIPDARAIECIAMLHVMLAIRPENKVYVHCLAGQNRSPTIVWLYLVANGMEPEQAKRLITTRTYDAVPGHGAMVDDELVRVVVEYGSQHFQRKDVPE